MKRNKKKLELKPVTVRLLAHDELRQIPGASGTLCQSGTPTVSSYNPTCR